MLTPRWVRRSSLVAPCNPSACLWRQQQNEELGVFRTAVTVESAAQACRHRLCPVCCSRCCAQRFNLDPSACLQLISTSLPWLAPPAVQNDKGVTALGIAVGFNRKDVVKLLIEKGADVMQVRAEQDGWDQGIHDWTAVTGY